MNGCHPAARIARLLEATPDELAVVDRVLGLKPSAPMTASGNTGVSVVVAGSGPVVEQVVVVMGDGSRRGGNSPRYAIRKGLKGWMLVYEGESEVLPDVLAVYYVAYLLRFPPVEPMHTSELANRAIGDAVVEGQRNTGADDGETLEQQRQARRKCLAVLDDDDATAEMKAEAERDLAEINEWALKHQRGTVGGGEKQVRMVRVAIRRLLDDLAVATDDRNRPHGVLRSFGTHLERYLWQPSSRGCGSRNARLKSGMAGRFVYEPPEGVKWEG